VDTPTIVALIALGGTIFTGFFTFRSSGRATDVNARAAELAWVKELRGDAADARSEVQQLRTEVRELRRQLEIAQREADHWLTEHQAMRRNVNRPGMTLDRLREMFGPADPPAAAATGR
jgi:chromosome segregation ATPase